MLQSIDWAPARWAKSASRCTASRASKETSPVGAADSPPLLSGAADSRHRSKAAPASVPQNGGFRMENPIQNPIKMDAHSCFFRSLTSCHKLSDLSSSQLSRLQHTRGSVTCSQCSRCSHRPMILYTTVYHCIL